MEPIISVISRNLREIRSTRGISLQVLADLTGVSKSMLGGIERGEVNPTISVMWKIARGLGIPFSFLIDEEQMPVERVLRDNLKKAVEGTGYDVYSVFPFREDRRFEIFMEELEPGANYETQGHNPGVIEYVMVGKGSLEISFENTLCRLKEGESLCFRADQHHGYSNDGISGARAFFVLFYSRN